MSRGLARHLGAGASLFPLVVLFTIELLDQATQSAFNVLIPNVRDAFHLTNGQILLIVAVAGAAALGCTVPVALWADRWVRVRIALIGAALSAAFSLALGLAPGVIFAAVMLAGVSMGQAVIFPTHNSLLADYYPVSARPRIYSTHRAGLAIGAIAGVLVGAGLATVFTWRAPFLFFPVPIAIMVLVGLRLREPRRGHHEQLALAEQMVASERGETTDRGGGDRGGGDRGGGDRGGGDRGGSPTERADAATALEAADATAEQPPTFGEAWRMVWKIGVLRRIFYALPLLAAAIVGFVSLASLQYQTTFHLDAVQRAFLVAPVQVFDVVGLVVGAAIATRLAATGMRRVFSMLGAAAVAASAFLVLFALAPSVPIAFVGNVGIDASLAVVGPGVLAALSLAIPPRARSIGFSIGALFVLPGLVLLPVVGAIGDRIGLRYGMLIMAPVFVVGGLVVASAGSLIDADVRDVWVSMQTRARMLAERRAGKLPLLAVRDLSVGYDGVTVLHEVTIEIAEGEIVALIGTNGAGKSTLLRSIGGVAEADKGAVVFDGRDITHAPPDEIARLGIAQVPGGEGVFPSLTVTENLRAAAWQGRRTGSDDGQMQARAFSLFPILAERRLERAANLSGGQQQQLALAMALLCRPKLLLVDELSLGLAPIVVEQLLRSLEELRSAGTAVLLVEQSVNLAVAIADRAYVMDNGVVRFSGTTSEIAEHPDLLWSIYLQKAAETMAARATAPEEPRVPAANPALEVRGVSVFFGGIAALEDVSLAAEVGEVVGVIGPNGAGKTTLFDVVSGFATPIRGSVLLHGVDITARSAAARGRLRLGRSFQDSRLFSGLTVAETLAVALERFIDVADPVNAVLRLPAQVDTEAAVAARVSELLELFSLGRFRDSLVSELSTGSRRLVDLAAVTAHQPDVLLLDEPSSGVAQREVEAMLEVLRRVQRQLSATLLVVEHDIAFISELADRLVALDRGSVLAAGPPADVLGSSTVGEAFLGTDPLLRSHAAAQGPDLASGTGGTVRIAP